MPPSHDWTAPLLASDITVLTLFQPVGKFARFTQCDYDIYLKVRSSCTMIATRFITHMHTEHDDGTSLPDEFALA